MTQEDFDYHFANLQELDPDQLVSDLNLTTSEIMVAFPKKVDDFIDKEFG